jgi:hypothetical protein
MSEQELLIISQAVGFGIFLWLGLYVLSRATYHTPIVITTLLGLFSQAAFFLSDHLVTITTDLGLHNVITRLSWWDNVLPMAVWFHLSSLISRERFRKRERPIFTPAVLLVYLAAVILSLLGMFTSTVMDNDHVMASGKAFFTPAGAGFLAYIIYLAVVGSGAFYNLCRTFIKKRNLRNAGTQIFTVQLALLSTGAILFLAGGLWLATRLYWHLEISELPGDIFVILGLFALGYGIANFNLLLEGQNVQRDFIYSFTGVALINFLYVCVLSLFGLNDIYILLVVGLVTVSHSSVDVGRGILDKLFFNRDEQAARADARAFALALASAPTDNLTLPQSEPELPTLALDQPETLPVSNNVSTITQTDLPTPVEMNEVSTTNNGDNSGEEAEGRTSSSETENNTLPSLQSNSQKDFNALVRKAITGLKNPTQLVRTPLLSLKVVGQRLEQMGLEDNRLNRASALREILIEQIEGLRPGDNTVSTNRTGDAWRFYNVLHYPYVREISRKGALSEARRLSEERRRNGQREPGQLEQVLTWLVDVDEDTFYKWQRRASDTIAEIMWEQEFKNAPQALEAALRIM